MTLTYALATITWLTLGGCDRTQKPEKTHDDAPAESARAKSSTAPSASAVTEVKSTPDTEKQVAELSGALVDAAFSDPAVQPQQDAAFEKVFADPAVAAAMNTVVQGCMEDPAIKKHVEDIAQTAIKDPKVMAAIQRLAASAADPNDVGKKMEKQITDAMAAPAVNKSIEDGVALLVAAPEVSARFDEIFKDADVSSLINGALKDPKVIALSGEVEGRIHKANADGRGK